MSDAQISQKKIALLIGNNEYVARDSLQCCVNDVDDLSTKLHSINFAITVEKNVDYARMRRAIDDFVDSISVGSLVLFFFAGHGTQWNDQNYLLPIDTDRIKKKEHLKDRAINAQDILQAMSNNNPVAIVFLLDCCRDYVVKNEALIDPRTRGNSASSTGLANMDAPGDSLIAFACAPGQMARDVAKNGRNGLFTFHLLQHITQPNVDIEIIMRDVCKGVRIDSNGTQKPHRVSSIETQHISLNTVDINTEDKVNPLDGVEITDLPKLDSSLNGNLDNVNDSNELSKLIANEIIKVLALDDDGENKDRIINDLLENGRQSLKNYEDDIVIEIYKEQMNGNDNDLMKLLKKYFQLKWKIQYSLSDQCFTSFLQQYQDNDNITYQHVLTRTAEYGNKYMKNCPILSIVLQLLFKGINDQCLNETNVFDELWFTITNDGLKSITKYSNYIIEDVLNQLILFQALREYHRPELFQFFNENNITDERNLYDLALDNVTEHGWINGLKATEKQTTGKQSKILLEKLDSLQQQNTTSQVNDNTELIRATTKSSYIPIKEEPVPPVSRVKIPPAQNIRKVGACGGNACTTCGRCRDWYYHGDMNRDVERFRKGDKYCGIIDKKRWQRRDRATCCHSFHHDPYGDTYFYLERICLCK